MLTLWVRGDVSEGTKYLHLSESAYASFKGSAEKCVMIHVADFRHFLSSKSLIKIAYFSLLATESKVMLTPSGAYTDNADARS